MRRASLLLAIQFPFADIRPFIPNHTGRVLRALLPNALPKEFVRGFGPVAVRVRGGLEEWPGEEVYCRATRAIRFEPGFAHLGSTFRNIFPPPYGAFRRFLSDGVAVARLEVGVGHRRRFAAKGLSADELVTLLGSFLSTPVRVRGPAGILVSRPLLHTGAHLATAYLQATTLRKGDTPVTPPQGWLSAGQPVVLVEYRVSEITKLPAWSRKATLSDMPGVALNYYRIVHNGIALGVWLLGIDADADKEQLRHLRLHLFRLHAERQTLRQVLGALARADIQLVRDNPQSDQLQSYLLGAVNLLERQQRFGLPQSALLIAAQDAEDFMTTGERATLVAGLASARVNIRRAVERFADKAQAAAALVQAAGSGASIYYFEKGATMSSSEIKFGDHAIFHGDFVGIGNQLQNSLNKIGQSDAPADLKAELGKLTTQIADLVSKLPREKAEQVSRDLDTLVTEATSPTPRRKWWELSADGIKEAAKTLGDIATPVLSTLAKVATFLA